MGWLTWPDWGHFAEEMRLVAKNKGIRRGIFKIIFKMMQLTELHLMNKFCF